jgi:hypothetical protein
MSRADRCLIWAAAIMVTLAWLAIFLAAAKPHLTGV